MVRCSAVVPAWFLGLKGGLNGCQYFSAASRLCTSLGQNSAAMGLSPADWICFQWSELLYGTSCHLLQASPVPTSTSHLLQRIQLKCRSWPSETNMEMAISESLQAKPVTDRSLLWEKLAPPIAGRDVLSFKQFDLPMCHGRVDPVRVQLSIPSLV